MTVFDDGDEDVMKMEMERMNDSDECDDGVETVKVNTVMVNGK